MKEQFYYRAAEIYDKGIFELLEMGTQFSIKVEAATYYCVVEEDSIFMYKNARGFESWLELIDQEDEVSDLRALELEYMKYGLSLSFGSLEDLGKTESKELKELKIDHRNMDRIPMFRHHEELTLPFRIKELDFKAMDALLITLSDIIENNSTLFNDEKRFFEEENDEFDEDEVELDEMIKSASITADNKVIWGESELPDVFNRYPAPALNQREATYYRDTRTNGMEWNLHLFIVPNANENSSHIFPIAGSLFEGDDRKILAYCLTRDYDEYCEDYLVEILDAIEEFGKPEVINVSTPRAESLIEKLCEQLDITVQLYSSFEDIDSMEVQLIKNFDY
jgi:hypothetical protein